MLIRNAVVSDAAAIAAIAESVRYSQADAIPARGYLVFVGTPEEYAARLENNTSSFVAEADGKAIAFLLTTYDTGDTATHIEGDAVRTRIFGDNALLVDQIGVSPDARGLGAGTKMLERMLADVAPSRATACIMHWPLRNERSVGFFEGRCGFRCIGEYHEGNGFLWGIYEWKKDCAGGDERYPLGQYMYNGLANEVDHAQRVQRLRGLPQLLRTSLDRLPLEKLDVAPRPGAWTARQIVHHIADGHQVMSARVRLILTEDRPEVKTFEENDWAELADAKSAPIEESLQILDGLHARLANLLDSRSHQDLEREMLHPQQGPVKLDRLLSYLDWHGRHHTAQIQSMAR
jgi:ribosomal protein S18 acetylase RimI-like enzyme/uncharacterized damage-inducible protein DinB